MKYYYEGNFHRLSLRLKTRIIISMIYIKLLIKNRKEKDNEEEQKEIVDNQYEKNDNDYIKYEDFITPNHYIGIKKYNVMLRSRNLRSLINHFK